MNKKTIITALLAIIWAAGQAKTYKTIKAPVAMACVNVHGGELKASEVIFRDTATIVHFTMEYPKGQSFQFVSSSYLMDEDGIRYPLRSAVGLKLNTWVQSPESCTMDFTMHFEPLPKKVQIFDFIEGDSPRAFKLLGIHDKKTKMKVPTMEELLEANLWTLPEDWFKTDTITVKGRIEGYDAEQFGFTSLECYFEDVFEKDDATLVLDIADDGTFCKKFQASYPVCQTFYIMETKVGFSEMPFYARPGEIIDITVKKNEQGSYVCVYNNGSSRDVEHWLRSSDEITGVLLPLGNFKGKFDEANVLADKVWQNVMYRLQTVSRREHYTPMEMQLALADVQTRFAEYYMSYAMYREFALTKQEVRDGVYHVEILDSVEWQNLFDIKNYYQLHRIDFDNPLLFASSDYPHLLNRMQFAKPVTNRKYKEMEDENGEVVANADNEKKELAGGYAALKELMGCDHDNMMAQLCAYKDMLSSFNYWRNNEDVIPRILEDIHADTTRTIAELKVDVESLRTPSNMMPLYLSTFTHPYVHQKAEQFYAQKMAQTDLSSPLPDAPMAELIRRLCEKYPGKYLIIDFWGMGCGPCRGAIQDSKNMRAEIGKRDDVKLVFIAGERTTEGSDAYKKYVAEWLADEETVCVTNADFTRLQELFHFNGIPHYETITPDCRRVRDDLQVQGFYNFDYELKRLLEKLK
ncbi:MAG: thioredoxin family protein [Bacteroidaceae bacterium]|nr:thioredoxin family protein [Bacteroidaceae bacterium]